MQLSLKDTLREARSAQMHTCAGMVLGIRMAILGCRLVGISEPRVEKVLKVYVEMDRCFTDAVGFLTGCSLGKRSLQHIDYGKPAATFHNTASEMAYRIAVPPDLRAYMESEKNGPRYGSGSKADLQKLAYCELPDYMMFRAERVKINRELIQMGLLKKLIDDRKLQTIVKMSVDMKETTAVIKRRQELIRQVLLNQWDDINDILLNEIVRGLS